ncbi:MAG TPA: helix-turn-helix domain-containing protein [Mycobacteriales bacterium]|nr:helix-turn-helix domain-containing protein [Mycobacteriales bacterium]
MASEGERRNAVLQVLKSAGEPLGIADIAERTGVHANTVRFHLDTLLERGQIESVQPDRGRPGRPRALFRPARGMDPTGPRRYRLLAEILATSLAGAADPEAEAVEAGRAWGAGLAESDVDSDRQPVRSLQNLLDELGFAPEPRDSAGQIGLRHCPFLELAQVRADVVCPIHLGLMRGAVEAWRAPVTIDALEPFAEPDLCLVHLGPAGAS